MDYKKIMPKGFIMAKVLEQKVKEGALNILKQIGVDIEHFTPNIVAQVPIMATGLLAKVKPGNIDFDAYNNPFILTNEGERVALALVIIYNNKIFVFNREGKNLQNLNEKLDVIGAVGFGISSGPFKWPNEMNMLKITRSYFSDFYAEEKTDGDGDKKIVLMPIVVVELENIDGLEENFIDIPNINDNQAAKLQAAIKTLNK
jgi:hypothetical protein